MRNVRFWPLALILSGLAASGGAAQAACSWSTLTNGTTANATQVMNNFDCLAPLANPNFTGLATVTNGILGVSDGGGGGRVFGHDTNHSIFFRAAGEDRTTYHEWGGTLAEGDGHLFYTGGSLGSQILRFQVANDGAYFTGSVGIGTASPAGKLHVFGNTGGAILMIDTSVSSTHPTLALAYAGTTYGSLSRNSNSGDIRLSSLQSGVDMQFTTTGAGGDFIFNNGNLGIGTTSPTEVLDVNGRIRVASLASASATALCINASVLSNCSSSLRYKEQVREAGFGLKEIGLMRPVLFKWKGRDERDFGLIAEEVAAINPLFVTRKDGRIEGVKYPQLTVVLVGAVRQQQAAIAALEAQNRAMRSRLERLERRLEPRTASR